MNIIARLDQFLIHSSWVLSGWDASSSIMPQGEFNDWPIKLIMEVGEDLEPIPSGSTQDSCEKKA